MVFTELREKIDSLDTSIISEERQAILSVASQAIEYGLQKKSYLPLDLKKYTNSLQAIQASFVTLEKKGQLRGCIGSLVAHMPLIQDVAHNAFNAAFQDPRFSPIESAEYAEISKHVSVLSTPKPMQFESEENLISQLRPGVDGLILTDQGHRGTFLPSPARDLDGF